MNSLTISQQIAVLRLKILELLGIIEKMQGATNREKLYNVALSCLGTDASPNDVAPDEYGCAETVNAIHKKAFGFEIGGDVSTYRMYDALLNSPYFVKVDQPDYGDIIISPSGHGNGKLESGHIGIMAKDKVVMSNSSATGKFVENYSLDSWTRRYRDMGGYPVLFFRRV